MAALASAPAAAQTLTISATGNCGGTPANCGASGNRNGDRDTNWPGLQVDEGDTVTFTAVASPASGQLYFRFSLIGSAANLTDLGQVRSTGANTGSVVGIPNRASYTLNPLSGYTQNVVIAVNTDSTAESDESLTFRIDVFENAVTLDPLPLPSPSTVTVTIRGTDSAPSFGTGSVSAKTFTAGAAITEFQVPAATGGNGAIGYAASGLIFDATGEDTPGCPGTEPREICGTPTAATSGAQTVTITATDADSNTMSTDSASLTFSVTVNAVPTLTSSPSTLTEDNLDGAILTVTLPTGFTFNAGVSAASFQLLTNPALADLSINTLSGGAMGTTTATLTLATGYGYGFDATATLAVRVLAAAHSGSGHLTTGTLPVTPSAPAVVEDRRPDFGEARAPAQFYVQGKEIEPLTLPGARGGDPPLTYALSPDLPQGLVWTPPQDGTTGGTIAGTPAVTAPAAVHTLSVTDADGDRATLEFSLEVTTDAQPTFGTAHAPSQRYVQGVEIEPLTLPGATGGNPPLAYTLSPALPKGLVWTPPGDGTTGGTIAGTPAAVQGPVRYTLKARDADGDTAALRFTLEVVDRLAARMEGVHEAILPKLSRAMTAGTVEAVAERIARALDRTPPEGSAAWAEALAAMDAGGWKQGLGGRTFALGLAGDEAAGGADVTVWGAGEYRSLSGGEAVAWDGDLFGAHLGVDTRFGTGGVAGLALSVSSGRFDYTDRSPLVRGRAVEGVYESRMTGAHPYLGWAWGEGRHAWASFGVGRGRVVVSDGEAGRQKSASTMGSAAMGGRLRVYESEGRLRVDVSGEAWTARLAVAGAGKANTHRLRVGAEGAREFSLGGASLTPSVELGMRLDGGDGEKAAGLELGGGVEYAHPGLDLGAELAGRVLVARGNREWSVGGTLRLAPASGLGLSLRVAPSYGEAGRGSRQRIPGPDRPLPVARLETEMGYGLAAFTGVVTPYGSLGLSGDGSHGLRLGARWRVDPAFEWELEGERQVGRNPRPGHALMLRGRIRW